MRLVSVNYGMKKSEIVSAAGELSLTLSRLNQSVLVKPSTAGYLAQFLLQQIIHLLWIGFALGCFHDLADQCIKCLFLAGFELGNVAGVCSDDFINQSFNGTSVGDLF